MPCYHPLKGWKGVGNKIVFNERQSLFGTPMAVPCGQCIGCRLERSRQWAIRCVHEASLYDDNCFITLTYDDEHLPHDLSLNLAHFQKFIKRLRKKFGKGVRYYHCGEYGDQLGRPHYHAILFNFDFSDKVLFKTSGDTKLYTSSTLTDLWGKGFASIGSVTFESAAYVARYVMKKINGDDADEHYTTTNSFTGEIVRRASEYTTMSRRPGIGQGWLKHYTRDVYPVDRVIMRGMSLKPPRYYDDIFGSIDPDTLAELKKNRVEKAKIHLDDQTPERLQVREAVQEARLKQLKRTLT